MQGVAIKKSQFLLQLVTNSIKGKKLFFPDDKFDGLSY